MLLATVADIQRLACVQMLRRHMMLHWMSVRRHHRRLQTLRMTRYRARLNLLAARSQMLRSALEPLVGDPMSVG